MFFSLGKKKPQHTHNSSPSRSRSRSRSSARFGGMQVRELQARLEIFLDAVLNRHHSVLEPAQALAEFSLIEQQRFLHSVDRISLINAEFALQFCNQAIPALTVLDDSEWEPWVDSLLKTLSSKGIGASVNRLKTFRTYQQEKTPDPGNVAFSEVSRILEVYLQALSGQNLKLETSAQSYTDTETLFLPAHINHFSSRDDNFRLYKALLVHQWAQTRFGTWCINLTEKLKIFPDEERALELFHALETLRLDACVKRELPGMSRDMAMFRVVARGSHHQWKDAEIQLQQAEACVQTTVDCLIMLYPHNGEPEAALYQGQLLPNKTLSVIAQRNQTKLSDLNNELNELKQNKSQRLTLPPSKTPAGFNNSSTVENDSPLLYPINQNHQETPGQYINSTYYVDAQTEPETPDELTINDDIDTLDYSYHEWDHSRQRYRNNWCLLHEQSVKPVDGLFVKQTLNKYRYLLKQLRKTFEAMRQYNLRLKREPFGDNIDIDSVVEAWVDTHHGLEASERLFMQTRRKNRNVAVMFMVDMSASTAGWINQVERESLILLCETLEVLGDRYAIYGFSGHGNRHCQSFHIKDFNESYNDEVRGRIVGIEAQDYTRLGAAIRHLGTRLSQIDASSKLLIALSDGRPDDVNGYRGRYGIEDTRRAVIEMRHLGIHPYCITIDSDAIDYIPHMFGKHSFTIINQVDQLPGKIANIYRRLTS